MTNSTFQCVEGHYCPPGTSDASDTPCLPGTWTTLTNASYPQDWYKIEYVTISDNIVGHARHNLLVVMAQGAHHRRSAALQDIIAQLVQNMQLNMHVLLEHILLVSHSQMLMNVLHVRLGCIA